MKPVYRAGTENGPSFEAIDSDEVWLVKNPALYYPLDQEGISRQTPTRTTPKVWLWKAEIKSPSKTLVIKDHPKFKEVYVVKGQQLKKGLKSLPWKKYTMPQCDGGMSVMDFNVIVQVVLEYMADNPSTTPLEYNYQAELKAASHWDWSKGDEPLKLAHGPHHDSRIKKAAEIVLSSWIEELGLKRQSVEQKQSSQVRAVKNEEESDSCDDIQRYISAVNGQSKRIARIAAASSWNGLWKLCNDRCACALAERDHKNLVLFSIDLQRDIMSLRMYYNGTLEESDDDRLTGVEHVANQVEALHLPSPRLKRKLSPDDNISGPSKEKSPKTVHQQSPRRNRSQACSNKGFNSKIQKMVPTAC